MPDIQEDDWWANYLKDELSINECYYRLFNKMKMPESEKYSEYYNTETKCPPNEKVQLSWERIVVFEGFAPQKLLPLSFPQSPWILWPHRRKLIDRRCWLAPLSKQTQDISTRQSFQNHHNAKGRNSKIIQRTPSQRLKNPSPIGWTNSHEKKFLQRVPPKECLES